MYILYRFFMCMYISVEWVCLWKLVAPFMKGKMNGEGGKFLWEFFICVHFYFMQFEQKKIK